MAPTTRAVIDLDVPGPTISRHLYGHFAEHLGRCVYGGFWVGEDSDIPHERGIRVDAVAPREHDGVRPHERGLVVDVPARSYVTVRLEPA